MAPNPVSRKCEIILNTPIPCEDGYRVFSGQRRFVMCRAFDLLEKNEAKSFGEGIKYAWNEVRSECLFKLRSIRQ